MTSEQRLDRLERIVKLMIRAGLRGRQHMRELDEKFEILADAQIRNEELFRRSREDWELRQARTDRKFDALVELLKKGRAGETSN